MSSKERRQLLDQIEARLLAYYRKNRSAIDFTASPAEVQRQYRKFVDDFVKMSNSELVRSGVSAADLYSELLGVSVIFDMLGGAYLDAATQTNARLATYLKTQGDLVLALTRQKAVDTTTLAGARMARSLMGLTFNQALQTFDYMERLKDLDDSLLNRKAESDTNRKRIHRAKKKGEKLTEGQINNMTTQYAKNLGNARAAVIAESESVRIVNQGLEIVTAQVINEGLAQDNEIIRVWNTMDDGKVRDSHRSMHGQKRKTGEAFISGNGNRLKFPGDPIAPANDIMGCRCILTIDLKRN